MHVGSRDEHITTPLEVEINPEVIALCREFATVFEEVKSMPPQRTRDHQIPLVPGAEPVNLRHVSLRAKEHH